MTTIESRDVARAAESDDRMEPRSSSDGRAITRRRGLPTSRAVFGGLLIALSAVGVFLAWLEARAAPTTEYLVLARPVTIGERIDASTVQREAMELAPSVAEHALVDAASVDGAVAIVPLAEGRLLQRTDILLPREGEDAEAPAWRELSFAIPSGRALDGAIVAGERIDLVATYDAPTNPTTTVVFRDGLVLAVDRSSTATLGAGDVLTLTVALTVPEEVMFAVNAIDSASELTIVRATTGAELELPERFAPGEGPSGGE